MYKISKTIYGLKLSFSNNIQPNEIQDWSADIKKELDFIKGNFGIVIEIKPIKTWKPVIFDLLIIQNIRRLTKQLGKIRIAIGLFDMKTISQLSSLSKEYGYHLNERYLDASKEYTWEKKALDWVLNAKDPYKILTELNDEESSINSRVILLN